MKSSSAEALLVNPRNDNESLVIRTETAVRKISCYAVSKIAWTVSVHQN